MRISSEIPPKKAAISNISPGGGDELRLSRGIDDAAPGTPLLAPESRDCVRAATALYCGILTEIERADYRVLEGRVSVSKPRRLAVFARRLTAAQLARVRVTMAKPNSRSSTGA